ncbi:hypothetical protein BDQ94DRAFT_149718 [Aspergillus welwitschiae]|uniref:Secreted protein n=1 Tax=Aspergillus welwitschiae TaxID=1341132 RepID=A0A3F3PSY5_9EURO|nr:hypothetical protein BDQ94DRAFT_149718 [Aspergillus welwitschiae]RDH29948.1 hypothetical protein BDQ94DRAFT_149718 [Aspergillus welwitschiae]
MEMLWYFYAVLVSHLFFRCFGDATARPAGLCSSSAYPLPTTEGKPRSPRVRLGFQAGKKSTAVIFEVIPV